MSVLYLLVQLQSSHTDKCTCIEFDFVNDLQVERFPHRVHSGAFLSDISRESQH